MEDWNLESTPRLLQKIGESIKGKRLQKSLSQEELSVASGVSLASITRLERGKGNTSLANLLAILKALGVAGELQSIFGPPEISPTLLAKAIKGKTRERVKRSKSSKRKEKGEWKWGEDK